MFMILCFSLSMKNMNADSLFKHFSIIKDLRQSWKSDHKLLNILLLTIGIVIAGADDLQHIGEIDHERLD